MNFKPFSCVFFVLLAVNVSVQTPIENSPMKDVVVAVIDKFLKISNFVLKEANVAIDIIEKDQDGIKDKIVDFAISIGKDINSIFLHNIDEFKDRATDQGKAVLDCVEGEKDKTEAAFAHIFGEIGNCAAGESPKVLEEIRNVLKQFQVFNDDIQSDTAALNSCTQSDLSCFMGFSVSLAKTAMKIPTFVWNDVEDIFGLVVTIFDDVSGCTGGIVKEFKSSAEDIFNDAVVCIKK